MNQKIVNLRALAILFIVLGHSIIIYDHSFKLLSTQVEMPLFETLKHWISFVQLKLFFSISGFLMFYKVLKWHKRTLREIWAGMCNFMSNKFLRLLIPYACVALLWMDPIKIVLDIPDYSWSIDLMLQQVRFENCGHLWYLPCLFFIFLFMYILLSVVHNSLFGHIILLSVLMVLNYKHTIFTEIFQLQNVAYYMVFFYLGYLINYIGTYMDKIKQFVVPPPHLSMLNGKYSICFKSTIVLLIFILIFVLGYLINLFTSIGFEFYASFILVIMFYYLMPAFKNSIVNEISNRSYGIYLFHSPMIYITAELCPNINPWLMLFINLIVFGGIAYFISVSLSLTKFKFVIGS